MNYIQVIAAAAFGLAMGLQAAPASATTFSYGSYSVVNDQNVTITGPAGFNETGGSGQIVLQNGGVSLATWCIDIFDWLQGSGTYTFSTVPSNNGTQPPMPLSAALSHAQIGEIGALISYGNTHLGDSYDVSSGTQIAIWETEDGALGYSFNGSAGANAEAAALLAMSLTPSYDWLALTSTNSLGLATNQELATAQEPMSLALLGVGVAVLGVVYRRKTT